MDQRSGDGWFIGGIEVFAIRFWKELCKFCDVGREGCFFSEQDHPEFPIQEEGQSGWTESPERGPYFTRKTDRFHDLRLFSSNCRPLIHYHVALIFLCYSSWWPHSGIRYKMRWCFTIYICQRFQPMIFWKVCISWEYVSLINSKLYWNFMTWRFIRRYRCPITKTSRPWWKSIDQKHRLRNFGARHGRIETWAVVKNQKGMSGVEGGKGNLIPVERKRPVFERRPMHSPAWKWWSCAETRTQSRHTFWANRITRSKCVQEKEVSEAKVTMVSFFDNRAEIVWKVFARDRFVNIGILPSANSTKLKRVAKSGMSVCSRIIRFMNNQTNKPKKGHYSHKRRESDDKNAVAIVKIVPHLGCVSQDSEALVSQRVKQLWGNQNTIHSVHVTSSKYRGKRGPSLGNRQVKHPHQRSPHAVKFDDRSHEETERRQRCARSKEWNFAKTFTSSKKKTNLHSFREECVHPAASAKEPEEREFVVKSGARMHVVSKRYFNLAKLETMRISKSPTTVMTADGEVQTEEEATVHVKELDLFVTVMFLVEIPTNLLLSGSSARIMGILASGPAVNKPHLTKNGKRIECKK